ncbi:MAG: hypothetical protein IJW74_04900 [Oscillospiraceae bacterium]|nr:hypothetical protein [Oscillospiraceae bacterium]
MKKKLIPILLTLCCILSACSSAGAISTYTMSLNEMPKNFDPQVAHSDNELLVLTNIYDGLFEYTDGQVVPNVCESWEISADGLTYTFTLGQSTFYLSKNEQIPVTSADFAFALNRVLNKSTHSPYYDDFSHINSINCPNDSTLIIRLKREDPSFLNKLCSPAAYPCNEEFFNGTNGAYGLRVNDILSNGPYTINYLADDGSYATIIRIDGNDKAISRIRVSLADEATDVISEYNNDKISGFFADSADISALDGTVYSYENQNFNMYMNFERKSLSSRYTRGALAYYAFAMENSGANLVAVKQSHSFFNSSVVFNNYPVTDLLERYEPSYMGSDAKNLLREGLAALEITQMENLTVLIPSDVSSKVVAENINQLWQKELGLFFTLESLPNSEIENRVQSGNFDIAFMSSKPAGSTPVSTLQPYKVCGGDIAMHISMMEQGYLSVSETVNSIKCAHNDIIEMAYVVPMCTDTSKYIHKSYFSGIDVNPFGNIVNLKNATVK